MVALWLLICRGASIELRHHLDGAIWHALWDAAFFVSSLLLCAVFGVALGNVVRGVPFTAAGEFFLPLWGAAGQAVRSGIFDGYTLLVGAAALAALALHGALWLALKLPGELETRARRLAGRLLWAAAAAGALVTAASLRVQPLLREHLAARPWGGVPALAALAGLGAAAWCLRRGALTAALLGSSAFLLGMLGAAACGLYPYALPGLPGGAPGLTVEAAAAPAYGLRVGLWWWVPGMLLAVAYSVHMYRSFGGKVAIAGAPGAEQTEAQAEGAAGY
jgi:cytochrome d ubiquinol oxidase subunit II